MEHPSQRNIDSMLPPLPAASTPDGVQQQSMYDGSPHSHDPPSDQNSPRSTPSPELNHSAFSLPPRVPFQPHPQPRSRPQQSFRETPTSSSDHSPVAQSPLDPELIRPIAEQVFNYPQNARVAPASPPTASTSRPCASSPVASDASFYSSERERQESLSSDTGASGRPGTNSTFSQSTARNSRDETDAYHAETRDRLSEHTQPGRPSEGKDSPPKARKHARSLGIDEATTLERIWTPLFDTAGNPTARLSQFLRGLALHIIDDYEPRASLVVTPAKMRRFFAEAQVQGELYPWSDIFGGVMSGAALSVMYRKLLCQHHLVQSQSHELPSVPGLTPVGFEAFLTCLIQAHPELEFRRLAKAVMNMPISNADNKSERFPKELSRRLLPFQPNLQAEQRLISSLNHQPEISAKLKNAHNMPLPPPPPKPPQQGSLAERERTPHVQGPYPAETDREVPSMPLERERKPYTAKAGTGKVYELEMRDRQESNPSRENGGRARSPRSYTGQSTSYFHLNGLTDNNCTPRVSSGRHRSSTNGNDLRSQTRTGNSSTTGRRSSPLRQPFTRSAPIDIYDVPPSQDPPKSHFNEPEVDGNLKRWHSHQSANRQYDMSASLDDAELFRHRSYPVPPRPPASMKASEPGRVSDRRNMRYQGINGPPA